MQDKFSNEGLKSLNSYFLYVLVLLILAALLLVSALLITGIDFLSGLSASPFSMLDTMSFVGGLGVLVFVVAYIIVYVMIVLSTLSLMFSIRDLRRSNLKSAALYTSISRLLKYLIVGGIVLYALSLIIELVTYSSALYIIFLALALIVAFVFGFKLYQYFNALAADLSNKVLAKSARLYLMSLGVGALFVVLSIVLALFGVTGGVLLILLLVIIVAGLALQLASMYFGYKGTKSLLM